MLIDSEPGVNSAGETEEAERTSRPTKEKNNQLHHIFDLSTDDDSKPFQTPVALRRKKWVVKYVVDSEPDEELQVERDGIQKEAVKWKRGQSKKKETKGEKQVGVKLNCYQSMTYRFVLFRGGLSMNQTGKLFHTTIDTVDDYCSSTAHRDSNHKFFNLLIWIILILFTVMRRVLLRELISPNFLLVQDSDANKPSQVLLYLMQNWFFIRVQQHQAALWSLSHLQRWLVKRTENQILRRVGYRWKMTHAKRRWLCQARWKELTYEWKRYGFSVLLVMTHSISVSCQGQVWTIGPQDS